MTKILPALLVVGLLSGVALAAKGAAAPAPPAKTAADSRATARARFIDHLSSGKLLSTLDGPGQAQLFANLAARFGESGRPVYGMFGADAALLMEVVAQAKNPGKYEPVRWELTSRYGSKLLLVRTAHGFEVSLGHSPQGLSLQVEQPGGKTREAKPADLEVFGISKPKHFERVLADAMDRVAPEDYQ